MSSQTIELQILGQNLRLNCPEEQQEFLRQAAKTLEAKVSELREHSGIIQLEKVLSIVALNLSYELMQQQKKNAQIEDQLHSHIMQLDHSLAQILPKGTENPSNNVNLS